MTDTRAAFEAWVREFMPDVSLRGDGVNMDRYELLGVRRMYGAWQAAINHERSECAKVCEDQASAHDDFHNSQAAIGCDGCAAAIRARSQP
jgi:hypothetical protein